MISNMAFVYQGSKQKINMLCHESGKFVDKSTTGVIDDILTIEKKYAIYTFSNVVIPFKCGYYMIHDVYKAVKLLLNS